MYQDCINLKKGKFHIFPSNYEKVFAISQLINQTYLTKKVCNRPHPSAFYKKGGLQHTTHRQRTLIKTAIAVKSFRAFFSRKFFATSYFFQFFKQDTSNRGSSKGYQTVMGLYILYIGLNMLQVDVLLYQTAVESSKVLRRRCAATASKKGLSFPFAPSTKQHVVAAPTMPQPRWQPFSRRLQMRRTTAVRSYNKTENRAFYYHR